MTYTNLLPTLCCSFLLVVAGCGGKSPGDEQTGTGTGTGDSTTGPGASTTTGDAPTTTEAASGTATTGDPGSGTTSTGEGSSSSSGFVSGTTTGGLECSLESQVGAAAAEGGEVDDCGVVTPEDPAPVWQAAHDCALLAVAEQRSFQLITPVPGADSEVVQGYVGVAGDEYLTEVFFFDGEPCEGCGPRVFRGICGDSLFATDNCAIGPAAVCLTCGAQGDILEVCG